MLNNILLDGEKEFIAVKCMDLVPLKMVLGQSFQQEKLNLCCTNYSLIIHSILQEPPYFERYIFDEIKCLLTRSELWVLHFYIHTHNGNKRKLTFTGESKDMIKYMIIPKVEYFINGNAIEKEVAEFNKIKIMNSRNDTPQNTMTINGKHNKTILGNSNENRMDVIYTMRGVQDMLEVFEDRVTITPKGVLGFMNKGIKGTKEIPFQSIGAVQFKEAGDVFSGYIQFTISGGIESRGGIFSAVRDENTFMYKHKKNNALVIEIKKYIDSAVRRLRTQQPNAPTTKLSDEIQKLAALKEQGILSSEEFQAAKKKLIG